MALVTWSCVAQNSLGAFQTGTIATSLGADRILVAVSRHCREIFGLQFKQALGTPSYTEHWWLPNE